MLISCSIVCYKNMPHQINAVLNSVFSSFANGSERPLVIVVDNSPSNELREIAEKFHCHYKHCPQNLGFGAAHNVAIRDALKAGSKYHLVLNPDVYFDEHVFDELLRFMETYVDVGLVMPRILYPNGDVQRLCKLLPTPSDLLLRRFWPALYERSGRLARYELHRSGYDKVMNVPSLSGCFMLIRAEVLKKIGLFDERFFMYLEDVDLSRRIGQATKTLYYPDVFITHEYQKGSYRNWKLLIQHIRSAILYFNKWGWLFDKEREAVNQSTLQKIKND